MDDQAASQGLKSLDAALSVLALIARLDGPQTLSDISKECGMAPSKVHRYLASFVQAGLVKQEGPSGRYGLGPEALQIGVKAITQHDFVEDVANDLLSLVSETGMTALISVWANQSATVVRWERGPTPTDTTIGLGSTLPLLNSATGHAFLAWAPKPVIEPVAERQMRQIARNPVGRLEAPTTKVELAELIKQTRSSGYASVVGNFIPGLVAIAAPVLDWQGEAQVVITLVGIDPATTLPDSEVVRSLVTYCQRKSFGGIED